MTDSSSTPRVRLAIPRSLIAEILILVHTVYGYPKVAIELISTSYHWPTSKRDVREHILSRGCRRREKSDNQRVAMLFARFLKPQVVLEMDVHGMGPRSDA